MSGFQFIHYEKYKKDDIAGIIGSIAHPGYCPHVEKCAGSDDSEREPRRTPGAAPARRSALQKTEQGRQAQKIRDDANIMLAGVFLIRMRQQNEVIRARKMARPLYEIHSIRVRRPTAYGGLHLDESHPHVHFYVIPRDYEMAAACRGDRASKETGKKLEAKKAMQSYQDDYFSQVSVNAGTRD